MKRLALLAVFHSGLTVTTVMAGATLNTLHIFNGTDGNGPIGALVQGTNGNFYGVTEFGGIGTNCISGCGTVFEISPDGAFTSLHSFTNYDGNGPRAGLVQASDGNLYGTTSAGGTFGPGGVGTVFRITPGGVLTMIYSFDVGGGGIDPEGALVEGNDGYLYGTTAAGGTFGVGTVFRITTNGVLTVLNGSDEPAAGVIQASDGNFYGTTEFGGSSTNCTYGCGTVFKITPNGVVTTLHSFDGTDGKEPLAGLVEGSDGNLYGTTSGGQAVGLGCSGGCGTVFMITTNGVFTNLYAFNGSDGKQPRASLVQGSDGNFYGTTYAGGGFFLGTVFQITTNGALTKLIAFNGSNGGGPSGGLVQDSKGDFYGTTEVGGSTNGMGTVFKITVDTNATVVTRCVLTPPFATNLVGTSYTVVATVTTNGVPRPGALVDFGVNSGPNRGLAAVVTTSASGQASFTYTNTNVPGIDAISALSLSVLAFATNVWLAPDSAGDGIPDFWRAQYFGGDGTTTNNLSCAACDADGTGQNNLFKYFAGLNPTNPASLFRFSMQYLNGQPAQRNLIFGPIAPARTYTLQFRTNLVTGAWTTFAGTRVTTNSQTTVTDHGASPTTKFYRVGISLP